MNPAAAPSSTDLERFQHAFAAALLDPEARDPSVDSLAAQSGFAVYRNTVIKGCIDALQASFPAVVRLVGEEWFRAAAAVHVRASPLAPGLLDYGAGFPFLESSSRLPTALPADVARLDRFWSEAHVAADDPVLVASAVSGLTPAQLESARLRPHAATRWQRFDAQPIFTIWQRNRDADDDETEIAWQGEAALITRPHGAVEARRIDAAACAFLDACAAGDTLAGAALAALDVDPQADLSQLMTLLLEAGAFAAFSAPQPITSNIQEMNP
jgi:hypothetical protein